MATMKATTAGGNEVEIVTSGTAYCGSPDAKLYLYFDHPKYGRCLVVAGHYDHQNGGVSGYGWTGVTGYHGGPSFRTKKTLPGATVRISHEDFDAAMAVANRDAEAAVEAEKVEATRRAVAAKSECPAGFVACRQKWSNGDLCSACYVTEDGIELLGSDLLENHAGWYWLPAATVEDARIKVRGEVDRREADRVTRDEKIAIAVASAKATGHRVEVGRWTEDCDGSTDECNTDVCVRYARPDGSIVVERSHTH